MPGDEIIPKSVVTAEDIDRASSVLIWAGIDCHWDSGEQRDAAISLGEWLCFWGNPSSATVPKTPDKSQIQMGLNALRAYGPRATYREDTEAAHRVEMWLENRINASLLNAQIKAELLSIRVVDTEISPAASDPERKDTKAVQALRLIT
jgi:hypothetical protein